MVMVLSGILKHLASGEGNSVRLGCLYLAKICGLRSPRLAPPLQRECRAVPGNVPFSAAFPRSPHQRRLARLSPPRVGSLEHSSRGHWVCTSFMAWDCLLVIPESGKGIPSAYP